IEYIVEYLHNEQQTAGACRTPARHSRCPNPPHIAWGAETRPCHCQTHSANLRRTATSRDRFFVPRAPPAGGERLDRSLVGAIGQRQTRQVLSPHAAWAKAARCRTIEVGDVLPGDGIDLESCGSGGTMISFFRKLGWLTRRRSKENQLTAELQFHLQEETEERQAAGMSAQDARWAARRELGNLRVVREDTRAMWSWTLLEQLGQDLRYGARTILRNPAFTILAALSLALGIGANTAIYSFMDALLMRSLPVADPRSLVVLKWHLTGK